MYSQEKMHFLSFAPSQAFSNFTASSANKSFLNILKPVLPTKDVSIFYSQFGQQKLFQYFKASFTN
jgi:hypothetical protein